MTWRELLCGGAAGLCAIAFVPPVAAEPVRICYDYGCTHETEIQLDEETLEALGRNFAEVDGVAAERAQIAETVGQLYSVAAALTPIWRDRGGNRQDDRDQPGAMDCLDHTANTTSFLQLMAKRGWVKHHTIAEPVHRIRFIFNEHWAARMVEIGTGQEYAVDTWYYDPGTPAAVMSLQAWRNWESPELHAKAGEP